MRCQFCVIRAVRRNLQFLPVWVRLRKKSIVQRDGQAQERAPAKLERNGRWLERKVSTFLVRAANAPVRAANAPYGELHTSTNSRSSDRERGEHTTKRLWSGRGPGQSRLNLRRSKALRWSVRLSSLTPPPAPDATVLTSSKLRFWHALEGKIKEEKTCRQGSWTVNCKLTTEKVCFFSPEGRSSEIARYAAAGCSDCEKIDRVQSTMYRPEVSRSAQTKKSTQLRVHTLAYLAIKASISPRNAAK